MVLPHFRENAPCIFSNAACTWCKCALLFEKSKAHFGKSKAHFGKIPLQVSFPDFSSRRFLASLAKKVYTFLLAILEMFTFSPIPCCSA